MATRSDIYKTPRGTRAIRFLVLFAGLLSSVALTVPAQVPVLGVQTSAACASGSGSCGG